jgi:type I restriction enzyme M protein
MNLAVHGLSGDIREGNTYYEDMHKSVGKFDYVMANPPFNVSKIEKDRLTNDPRFPYGIPKTDNGNYLWIQIFASSLSPKGRAGFVMANSAADARSSELEVRRQMIEDGIVDVVVSIGSNFFYTVTLPCTLWFLDKGKKGTPREKNVLFIDARNIYNQLDRAHRDFTPAQGEFVANIVRLYRGVEPEDLHGGKAKTREVFKGLKYGDVAGLCKMSTLTEIEGQGWSLNPGRYIGVTDRISDDFDFAVVFEKLTEQFVNLTLESEQLAATVIQNCTQVLADGE